MKKKKAPAAALSVFSAVLTAGTICAASVLSAFPVFAAAAPNGNTAAEASQNETAGNTEEAASQSETAAGAAETDPVRRFLEEYAGGLDNLYGKTYTGYLWDVKKEEFSSRQGYDTTEIPASDAAFRIDDYDQDGTDELLVVSVKEDSSTTGNPKSMPQNRDQDIPVSFPMTRTVPASVLTAQDSECRQPEGYGPFSQ